MWQYSDFLTLESRCSQVMGVGVLVSRTYTNRLNKVQEVCYLHKVAQGFVAVAVTRSSSLSVLVPVQS